MALPSSVPNIQFTPAGLVIPTEASVLSGVQADINAAFGGGLNQSLETPQGQLASSQAAVIGDKNNEFAYFVNQVDPQYADGRFQDAIGRFYFLTRKPATATAVTATLTGISGTTVPAGTLAQDTSGNTYSCSSDAIIGITGTVEAEFQNIETGPIPCAAGTLTQVYQAIPGWDAITNSSAGTLGRDVESRADFEYRRKNSVAINAKGTNGAVYGAVFALPDVLDVYVLDNPKSVPQSFGVTDYELSPHSIYVAVVGGLDADIANAMWRKVDAGCDYNGNTSVVITDDSGYSYPKPTYVIQFERPAPASVKFFVQIQSDPQLPQNVVQLVKSAIIGRFNGTDGSQRERIGARIFHSRYYSAIMAAVPNAAIVEIEIGLSIANASFVDIGIDQYPTVSDGDIQVEIL